MSRRSLAVLGASILLIGLAQDAGAQVKAAEKASGSAVRAAIDTENAQFVAAMKGGDAARAALIYTDDAIVLAPGGPAMKGREAIVAGLGGWLSQVAIKDFALTTEDVTVSGDYAFETGSYTMTTQAKNATESQTDSGKFVTVWKKQGSTWKLVRDIWNSNSGM